MLLVILKAKTWLNYLFHRPSSAQKCTLRSTIVSRNFEPEEVL